MLLDQRAFTHASNMLDDPDGPCDLDGAAEARRWPDGREDDANHDHVPTDKAQNGGICVPKSLHSFKPRFVDSPTI